MSSKINARKRLDYRQKRQQTSYKKETSMKKQINQETVEEVKPNTEQPHQQEPDSKKVGSVPQEENTVFVGKKQLPSRYIYIVIILVTSIFTIIAFWLLSYSFHRNAERIINAQNDDYIILSRLLNDTTSMRTFIYNDGLRNLESTLDKHYERTQGLLELQYDKLQNDFNFISLWAATITIVFLVFSIYSIFKTDEMLSHANEETMEIHKLSLDSKLHYREIETDIKLAQSKTSELSSKAGALETRIRSFEDKMDRFDKDIGYPNVGDSSEDSSDETEK